MHNASMGPEQKEPKLVRWTEPPPMEPGAPRPVVCSNGRGLFCAYFISPSAAPEGSVALLKFESVLQHRLGYPNDEALQGHPLYQFGLEHYDFFAVENSPLIDKIEKQNRCHSQHRPGIYARFRHWVITFHDETLEVIALRSVVLRLTRSSPDKAVSEASAE
jgi:hypothetical protein